MDRFQSQLLCKSLITRSHFNKCSYHVNKHEINSALVHLVQIKHCSHLKEEGAYDFVFTAVEETDLGKPEAEFCHAGP